MMKILKLSAFFLYFLSVNAAASEWSLVTSNDNALYYVDSESIRVKAGYVQAWSRTDFLLKQKDGSRSMKLLLRFNCEDELMSISSTITYTEASGGGESNSATEPYPKYSPVAPDTIGDAMLQHVCELAKASQ